MNNLMVLFTLSRFYSILFAPLSLMKKEKKNKNIVIGRRFYLYIFEVNAAFVFSIDLCHELFFHCYHKVLLLLISKF